MITESMRPMELERDDGDEFYPNGIFEFHITRMIEYINQHQDEFEKVKIDVEYYQWSSIINLCPRASKNTRSIGMES